jgi:phytoene dehydrogenase-like protein
VIRFKYADLYYEEWGTTVRFPDGTEIGSWPHPELPHYHVIAHRLGYGDDLLSYCREHEAAHLFVEEVFHDRPSRVLWALAHGEMLSGKAAVYEESMAQVLQRWVRCNEQPIIGGVNWFVLRDKFLGLIGEMQ